MALIDWQIARRAGVSEGVLFQRFTTKGVYDEGNAHLSFTQGGGHGGSHPHLVHEFVSSIVEGRASFPDVYQSVNWTCAGICAHESAMQDGRKVALPDFLGESAAGAQK